MSRSLRFALGWLAAAVVAVAISWTVIKDAVDPGRLSGGADPGEVAAPAVVGKATAQTAGAPQATAGGSATDPRVPVTGSSPPPVTPPATRPITAPATRPATGTSTRPAGETATGATTRPSSTEVRSYPVTGGRVLLRLTGTTAQLVSATPDDGYRVQSWENDGWLRVDFSLDGTTRSSVFATWNGTPPTVRTVAY